MALFDNRKNAGRRRATPFRNNCVGLLKAVVAAALLS